MITNLLFGTYFEGYEISANQTILGAFNAPIGNDLILDNVHFGMLPAYSYITQLLPNIPVYSLILTFFNFVILYTFTLYSLTIFEKGNYPKYIKILVLTVVFVFLFDSVLSCNSVRIAFLLSSSFFFWMHYLIKTKSKQRIYYMLLCCMFLVSLSIRMEMVLIVSALSFLHYILFFNSKLFKLSGLTFIIAIIMFSVYNIAQQKIYPELYVMHKAEHKFIDRNGFDHRDINIDNPLIALAFENFIVDTSVYDINDYEEVILNSKSGLLSDLLQEDFKHIYIDKLNELWQGFSSYKWLMISTLLLLLIFVAILLKFEKLKSVKVRYFLFVSAAFLLPFTINIILILPLRFVVPYVTMINLFLLFSSIRYIKGEEKIIYSRLFLILIIPILLSAIFYNLKIGYERNNIILSSEFNKLLVSAKEQNIKVVISNLSEVDMYPARLFSTNKKNVTPHYYLDMFFFSYYQFYKKHHKSFFGKGFKSLDNRVMTISNRNDIIFLSNPEYVDFLKQYLSEVHNKKYDFIITDSYKSTNLQSYQILRIE